MGSRLRRSAVTRKMALHIPNNTSIVPQSEYQASTIDYAHRSALHRFIPSRVDQGKQLLSSDLPYLDSLDRLAQSIVRLPGDYC